MYFAAFCLSDVGLVFGEHGRMETEFPVNERAARIAEQDEIIGI